VADTFFSGDKSTKEEARKTLMSHIADNWPGTFYVDFWSDGGGHVIRGIVEVENTEIELEKDFREKFPPKWLGWRLVVLKVTPGYIGAFLRK
jgi:hypothetical protein